MFSMTRANPYAGRIVKDPDVLVGKPVVKGTRVSVEEVLAHLAENPDVNDLLAAFPRLSMADVKACLAYAEEQVRSGGAHAASSG